MCTQPERYPGLSSQSHPPKTWLKVKMIAGRKIHSEIVDSSWSREDDVLFSVAFFSFRKWIPWTFVTFQTLRPFLVSPRPVSSLHKLLCIYTDDLSDRPVLSKDAMHPICSIETITFRSETAWNNRVSGLLATFPVAESASHGPVLGNEETQTVL